MLRSAWLVALVLVPAVAFGIVVTSLAAAEQSQHGRRAILGNLLTSAVTENAVRWEVLALGDTSDGLKRELANARAGSGAALGALSTIADPASYTRISQLLHTFQAAASEQISMVVTGRVDEARASDETSTRAAFQALVAAVDDMQLQAASGAATSAALQTAWSIGAFGTAALLVLVVFLPYRRRIAAEVLSAAAARQRTLAVDALRRLVPLSSPESIGQQITETLLRLPHVDVALVFGFVGTTDITVLAVSGPDGYPLAAGDLLPPARATVLRSRARGGAWAETWQPQVADGAYAVQLTRAGLRAVAFGPIGDPADPAGLLVVGTTQDGQVELVENMNAMVEFATGASLLLGGALAARRNAAAARAEFTDLVASQAFHPVFQPIVHLRTGRAVGYEALTRFHEGSRPDLMFARAASVGAGRDLEAATLEAAIEASRDLPVGPWLSLNVSADFLVGDPRLRELLSARTRPIVLEITEHDVIADYNAVRAAVAALGPDIRIAVDDAGAGVANFAHILDLRPNFVKIDSSLVRDLDGDPHRQALIAGLDKFARATEGWLIAEGVETEAERTTLESLNVEFGQGFLLAVPKRTTEFDEAEQPRSSGRRGAENQRGRGDVLVGDLGSPPARLARSA